MTGPDGQPRPTWIVSGLARLPGARPGSGSGSGEPHHTYRLFAERPVSGCRPSQVWITNMPHRRMDELLALTRLHTGTRAVRRSLEVDFGLRDFEGRSFPGWHHHMTLVSAAYAYSFYWPGRPRSRSDWPPCPPNAAPEQALSALFAVRG